MPSYETLDTIADAVNPVLLIATLLLPALPVVRARIGTILWYVRVVAALCIVYGLMALDVRFGLWAAFGSDYSTHTAFAVALAALWYRAGRTLFLVVAGVVLLYCGLMLYQRYHTLLDLATTALIVGLLTTGIAWLIDRRDLRAAAET